jgi:hypothetical protein
VLDRILRDEVRHRDFGWVLLGWLLDSRGNGARVRELVDRELPAWFHRLRFLYGPPGAARQARLPPGEARWGLMPPARYDAILALTFERDYVPRFRRLGIDARPAWSASEVMRGPVPRSERPAG